MHGIEPLIMLMGPGCVQVTRVQTPVDAAVSLEVFRFIEAAEESKRRGGAAVTLADVTAAARGR